MRRLHPEAYETIGQYDNFEPGGLAPYLKFQAFLIRLRFTRIDDRTTRRLFWGIFLGHMAAYTIIVMNYELLMPKWLKWLLGY
ncbi:hypothetical protein [Pyruvatibacter sp.]|uniref:hypothetical protein n=1 Tax=Pyruvatibacter sp. TaxID=1981328 RepID=UPI003263CA3B